MSTTERPLLIVDDDPGLLRQLRWAFSDHKVYPANTRQEAADLVRKDPVPVAIVDLGLPPDPAGSNLSKAAKLLGTSRPTLYDLMRQHRIGLDL